MYYGKYPIVHDPNWTVGEINLLFPGQMQAAGQYFNHNKISLELEY